MGRLVIISVLKGLIMRTANKLAMMCKKKKIVPAIWWVMAHYLNSFCQLKTNSSLLTYFYLQLMELLSIFEP